MKLIIMIKHQCFQTKQIFLKPKIIKKWIFFKKTIGVIAIEFVKVPAVTVSQKINCEC